MVNILLFILYVLIAITLCSSVYNSVRSHRVQDTRARGLYAARMNISLGALLILLAVIQLFLFSGSSIRVVVGALFLLLGCFNLYAGFRNHSYFKRMAYNNI